MSLTNTGQSGGGHVSHAQQKFMFAIEACQTDSLGGQVVACIKYNRQHIAYNSCKNHHCPKCQGSAAHALMVARRKSVTNRVFPGRL